MRRFALVCLAVLAVFPFSLLLAGVALAQGVTLPAGDDPTAIVTQALQWLAQGNWIALAACVSIGVSYVVRHYLTKLNPWFRSNVGGILVAVLGALFTVVAGELIARKPLNVATAIEVLKLTFFAAGGFSLFKAAAKPAEQPATPAK